MIEIRKGEKKYLVCMNPVFYKESGELVFPNCEIGEKRLFCGKILRLDDIEKFVKVDDVIAIYYEGNIEVNKLMTLKKKGIVFILSRSKGLYDLAGNIDIPVMLWDEEHIADELFTMSDLVDITVTYDLSGLKVCKADYGCKMIYSKDLEVNLLIDRINKSLNQLLTLLLGLKVFGFMIYYFKDIEQLHLLTGMNATLAYKDKIVFLVYSERHNNTELHEISHILLYHLGDPPFLLKEGLPTLVYELLQKKYRFSRSVCNIYMRNRLIKKLSYNSIDKLVGCVVSDRIYNGEDYYTAASFLSWLIEHSGLAPVLKCYEKINRNYSVKQNIEIMEAIFEESMETMIVKWKERLLM